VISPGRVVLNADDGLDLHWGIDCVALSWVVSVDNDRL